MKKTQIKQNIFIYLIFILFSLITQDLNAQQSIDIDSIKVGSKYKIILFDDREYIGKVISKDSIYIKLNSDEGIYRFRADDVFSVDKDLRPAFYPLSIGLKGGVSFLMGNYYNYYYSDRGNTRRGFDIAIDYTFPFRENKAFRLELDYTRVKRDAFKDNYSEVEQSYVNLVSARGDIVFGNFSNKSKYVYFAGIGIGFHYSKEEEYTERHFSQIYGTDSVIVYTYKNGNKERTSLLLGAGVHGGIKLTKNLETFAEIQYNLITYESFFIFSGNSYLPIRAGISYIF